MIAVRYLHDTKEAKNLSHFLLTCNDFFFTGAETGYKVEEIGLTFPQGEQYCAKDLYAFAFIVDEKKFLLAKLKYGI